MGYALVPPSFILHIQDIVIFVMPLVRETDRELKQEMMCLWGSYKSNLKLSFFQKIEFGWSPLLCAATLLGPPYKLY